MRKIPQALEQLFFKKKKEPVLEDAAKFVAAFLLSGGAAYSVLSLTGNFFHKTAALSSAFLAKSFFEVELVEGGAFPHLAGSANGVFFDAEISDLCAGWLELAVMAGLVLASRDKPLRERFKGIFFGALVLLVFNPLRIFFTLAAVGTPFLALAHDILFRMMLVIVLVSFYAVWYYWKTP